NVLTAAEAMGFAEINRIWHEEFDVYKADLAEEAAELSRVAEKYRIRAGLLTILNPEMEDERARAREIATNVLDAVQYAQNAPRSAQGSSVVGTSAAQGSTEKQTPTSPAGKSPTLQLQSWTQVDLDNAIREYKAQRARQYADLKKGVEAGKKGAIK